MKKNVASQSIGAQMVSSADGSAFTSAVTVYVCGDAGTQAVGSVGAGACTHEGNGYHTYAPAQAETNYDLIAFTFIGTLAVPATVQVFTDFPQTGDSFARIGAAGASLTALGDTRIANLDAAVSTIAPAVWDAAIAGHVTAGSTGLSLFNAGAAADPWSVPLPGAYVAGTAGYVIGHWVATPGAGAITWPYTLTDSVSALPIADADVWVTTDSGGTNVIASGRTDAYGVVTFYLDAGTVYLFRAKSGENFVNPQTQTVAP